MTRLRGARHDLSRLFCRAGGSLASAPPSEGVHALSLLWRVYTLYAKIFGHFICELDSARTQTETSN